MTPKRRPPLEITPQQFFETWLPAEILRLGSTSGLPGMWIRIELAGEAGGAWDLRVANGSLEVKAKDAARAVRVTLNLSVEDWRAALVGEDGAESLAPPATSATDLLFLDGSSQQLLAASSGTFRFEIHKFQGRTWSLRATFGALTDPPVATIATDMETYTALLSRKLTAPEALFSRRIVIQGDVGRGMQVGLALLPKL
jgi:hypothetical protein